MSSAHHPQTLRPTPPEAWEPLFRLARLARRPLDRFLHIEAASGLVLIFTALIALFWANSPWATSYFHLWHTPIGIRIGHFTFERPLEWFVNDGLMVIFFFVVGMEIRRELHHGELSEWRRAMLPVAAALGGMLAPAGIYLVLAGAPPTRSGWGVPMATDIAFALGILTLLGKRVPPSLRVLLLALAVIDDLGSIIVIAIFYSTGVSLPALGIAAIGLLSIWLMQRLGVRSKATYILPAAVIWGGIYAAGIHPTIGGVIVGLVTPVRAWLGPDGLMIGLQKELDRLTQSPVSSLTPHELSETLKQVEIARREAMSPAESLIDLLHPWVAFAIMPVFALANAGVVVSLKQMNGQSWQIATAIAIALVLGKLVGVFLSSWLTVRVGLGALPSGMGNRHLVVLGAVAGVGFTMALFVAQLAFTEPAKLSAAKLGILTASALASMLGLLLGRLILSKEETPQGARSADEAESSTEH